jgi:hypothetical protein
MKTLIEAPVVIGGKTYKTASEAIGELLSMGKTREEIQELTNASPANIYRVARAQGLTSTIRVEAGSPEQSSQTAAANAVKALPAYADPKVVFDDLRDLVAMVLDGKQPSLIVTGGAGSGKSYSITKQIEESGLRKNIDWVHSKGHASPFGLYRTLYENKDNLIVFDDTDSILKDAIAINILKAALDSYEVREITWKSKSTFNAAGMDSETIDQAIEDGRLPDRFDFTGKVIFISNLPINQFDAALRSRSFAIDITLRSEDVILRIETILPSIAPDSPLPLKKKALQYIRDNVELMVKGNETLNMRTFLNTLKIMQSGSPNWERLVKKYARA